MMNLFNALLQLFVFVADGLEQGQQHEALGADGDARPAALKQLDAPFPFQVGNHAADGGLGVAQLLRCGGDAAGLDGL